MTQPSDVTVFRAPRGLRIGAIVAIVVLAILLARVLLTYGWYATIGALLVAGLIANVWWVLLRPKLVASARGLDVVSAWQPVHIAWKDVRRVEVGPKGTLIVRSGGAQTHSRYPAGTRSTSSTAAETDADRAAAFLAACAAWGRRGTGPMPTYPLPSR